MSWFKTKGSDSEVEITCPHCKSSQKVQENISAVFCKTCSKTIFPKKNASKTTDDQPAMEVKLHADESKPEIKNETQTKKIQEVINKETPQQAKATEFSNVSSAMKTIICSNCKTSQEVPKIALASFCEKCGQRVNLQDYKIKGYFHGELETRGEIRIAVGAEVKAKLNVGTAVIEGKIDGEILAERKVELMNGCFVVGTIISNALVVEEGAGFIGKAIINPPKEEKK